MKHLVKMLIASAMITGYCACQNPHPAGSPQRFSGNYNDNDSNWGQPFIPVSTADTMITSYLTSIDYESNDSNVRSFIIDANALRKYLTTGKGQEVTQMKLILAHNEEYIKDGGYGKPCGYSNKALTIVLVGFGQDGNYIYAPKNKVMDFSMPCPKNCPVTGSATKDILPNNP